MKEGLDLLNRETFDAVTVGHRFSAEENISWPLRPRRRRTRRLYWCAEPLKIPRFLRTAESMRWRATLACCQRCLACVPPRPRLGRKRPKGPSGFTGSCESTIGKQGRER